MTQHAGFLALTTALRGSRLLVPIDTIEQVLSPDLHLDRRPSDGAKAYLITRVANWEVIESPEQIQQMLGQTRVPVITYDDIARAPLAATRELFSFSQERRCSVPTGIILAILAGVVLGLVYP